MVTLVNRAKMSTATTGTGTITLGSASSGYQTFANAGVADGDTVRYVIEDGTNWEVGYGTYTSSGTTLSRNVLESSNSDTAISLSGSAVVFVGASAEDISKLVRVTTVSSTSTLNISSGNFFRLAPVYESRTVSLSGIPTSGAYSGLIEFPYYAGTVTWPSQFSWENSTAPTLVANQDYLVSMTRADTATATVKAVSFGPFASTVPSPAFIGSASATSDGNSNTVVSLTALTGGARAAPLQNDIVVVCCHVSDNVNVPTMNTAGYTTAATGTANDDFDSGLLVAYKIMGATPDTSVTINGNANLNDSQTAIVFVFSGVNTTTPLDVTPTVSQVVNTALANPPSITASATATNANILLGIGGCGHNGGVDTYSAVAGQYNTFVSVGRDNSNDSTLGVGYKYAFTSQTYDPAAFTFSQTDSVQFSNVAVSLILRGAQ